MQIKGFREISYTAWDNMISAVILLPGCNLRCPFCFTKKLVMQPEKLDTVPWARVRLSLEKNKSFLDGAVITGGEPTIHLDLPELCQRIKDIGLKVKIDTNGTNPTMLEHLITMQLVDYISLDVKAPIETVQYYKSIGLDDKEAVVAIRRSISLLRNSGIEHEFRTTVVPGMHTLNDIKSIANSIRGGKKYVIQNYHPGDTLNSRFANLEPFETRKVNVFVNAVREFIKNTWKKDRRPSWADRLKEEVKPRPGVDF